MTYHLDYFVEYEFILWNMTYHLDYSLEYNLPFRLLFEYDMPFRFCFGI